MTKEEILNYVMDTPENTNRAVLSDMLDELVSNSGGGGGLVVETEWEARAYPASPRFKSTILGTDLRAVIASGRNVVVHIPGNGNYSVPECYFTPILRLTDSFGDKDVEYLLPSTDFGALQHGNDDNDGYVQFEVYVD